MAIIIGSNLHQLSPATMLLFWRLAMFHQQSTTLSTSSTSNTACELTVAEVPVNSRGVSLARLNESNLIVDLCHESKSSVLWTMVTTDNTNVANQYPMRTIFAKHIDIQPPLIATSFPMKYLRERIKTLFDVELSATPEILAQLDHDFTFSVQLLTLFVQWLDNYYKGFRKEKNYSDLLGTLSRQKVNMVCMLCSILFLFLYCIYMLTFQ
jgi:hypothetical protein